MRTRGYWGAFTGNGGSGGITAEAMILVPACKFLVVDVRVTKPMNLGVSIMPPRSSGRHHAQARCAGLLSQALPLRGPLPALSREGSAREAAEWDRGW